MKKTTSGFTIVELLIVIVVIAILAAITIVAFNGIQNRARDTAVQSDMKQTYNRVAQFQIVNGAYPTTNADINATFAASRESYFGGNFYLYCRTDTSTAIVGRSKSGKGYAYSSESGAVSFASWPGDSNANLCPAAGIPTASAGYAFSWIGEASAWKTWYTPGS